MGRAKRNDELTGWFHITNRGARRYDTFVTESDRQVFFNALARQSSLRGVDLVALCLMANHYHLVVHCPVGNLSAMMQSVGTVYSQHFNRTHGFDGPLHRQRYHSKALVDDSYLLAATRYVHRNPLEVGFDIASYPWSSYAAYAMGSQSVRGLRFSVDIPLLLAGGRTKYKAFVEQDLATDKALLSDGVRAHKGIREHMAPSLDEICAAVSTASAGSPLTGVGSRSIARRRHLAVLLAADRGAHSLEAIAAHHGFRSTSSVYTAIRRARQRIEEDPQTAQVATKTLFILRSAQ